MADSHIARTVTYTDENGDEQTMTVYEAQRGVRGGASERKWYVCQQCRFSFPETDIMLVRGVPYCIPNNCYEEQLDKE